MGTLIGLFSRLFAWYVHSLSRVGALILPIYESLPRCVRLGILIMFPPFVFSLFVATAYYNFLAFHKIWR